MLQKVAKHLAVLRKHLPTEAVDALEAILNSSTSPLVPRAPLELSGIAGQTTKAWSEKQTQGEVQPAMVLGEKAQALFRGPAMGVGKWCKTVAAYTTTTNARNGVTEYRVQCRDTDNEQGLRTTGTIFQVYLLMTGGGVPKLAVGDTMMYFYAVDGLRVAFPSELAAYPFTYTTYEGGWGVI